MRPILSERNVVVVLFIMVLVTFSLAHEDSKKMEQIYLENSDPAPPTHHVVENKSQEKNIKLTPVPASFRE